jgi:PAS domain S-box-containing protein
MMVAGNWIPAVLAALVLIVSLLYVQSVRDRRRLEADLGRLREALDEKEWMLRAVLDTVPASINLKDEHGHYRFVNKALADVYGLTPEDAVVQWNRMQDEGSAGQDPERVVPKDPYDYQIVAAKDRLVLETGKRTEFADTLYEVDGRNEIWSSSKLPLVDRRSGTRYVLTVAFDVTHQRGIEEKLRQAQKMEAIGQLTGGIAHDFNNLLTVIIGNLELVLQDAPVVARQGDRVRSAMAAAERGAGLTHRLLAFARQQPLSPVSMDLNETVRGMRTLLARTLGEQIEIELATAGELWHCVADPSQIENAILNLAINARDAMPNGGKLTIETANAWLDEDGAAAAELTPGQYVMISVTDNGTGMTDEVKRKAFEPFFTTKDVGKGSGLGLAMIYGFAKQSGGHVKIYSEIGLGTSVKIYLPRSYAQPRRAEPEAEAGELPQGRGQVVLVVEDDESVRRLAVTLLGDLGYRVVEAASGAAALALAEGQPRIDLLFTDVALPGGIDGRHLSEALARKRPGLRTLFMSGYSANAIIHHGRLDPGVQLLQKPFRKRDLASAVSKALDG